MHADSRFSIISKSATGEVCCLISFERTPLACQTAKAPVNEQQCMHWHTESDLDHFDAVQVNIRYVPNQSGERLVAAVKHHLAHEFNKRHSPNTMSVRILQNADWYVQPAPSTRISQLACQTVLF